MEPITERIMSTTPASALNSLKQCSICFENYSKPKVLPCQHSYCYSCLVNIASGQSRITCPHCREEHQIPESGVSGFRDSLVINQLLSISLPSSEYCTDCKAEAVVSQCEHCSTCVCTQCLVQHAKLCIEISTSLTHLQEELMSPDTRKMLELKKSQLQASRGDLQKEYDCQMTILDDQLKELKMTLERVSSLSDFVKSSICIHDDLIAVSTGKLPYNSYFSGLARRSEDCKTSDSLQRLKEKLKDFKTVSRLIQKKCDSFTFSLDIKKHDLTDNVTVQYGQTLVDVRGKYERDALIKRLNELRATAIDSDSAMSDENTVILKADAGTCDNVEKKREDVVGNVGLEEEGEKKEKKELLEMRSGSEEAIGGTSADIESKTVEDEDHSSKTEEHVACKSANHNGEIHNRQRKPRNRSRRRHVAQTYYRSSSSHVRSVSSLDDLTTCPAYRQDDLPKGLDHLTLGKNTIIIGQNKQLKFKLSRPYSCAYHVGRDRIYIADNGNDKIVSYSACGNESRLFYPHMYNPRDIAVISDGKFICLAKSTGIYIVCSNSKRLHESFKTCTLGDFQDCRSVLCHGTQLIVVERRYRSLIVFEDDKEIRHFGLDHLKQPSMLAYNPSSQLFFVTDLHLSCVKVFTWEGNYVETFAAQDLNNDVSGIAVDADDYVYVARILSNRIDIYNPRRELIRSITSVDLQHPLKSPNGLCLMPNGKLIVADTENDRLQILG